MFMKITLIAGLLLSATAFAESAPVQCQREGSTKSFRLDLNAYSDNQHQYAAVDVIQYPSEKKLFYRIQEDSSANGIRKIVLFNPEVYFQADRTLVMRLDAQGHITLEVFWIRGSTGFGFGGESGSVIYECR